MDAGNAAAKAGTLGSTVEKILPISSWKQPVSSLTTAGNGRGHSFDMKDSSEIPAVTETWFLAFNAKISFRPIMNPQDLAAAGNFSVNVTQ